MSKKRLPWLWVMAFCTVVPLYGDQDGNVPKLLITALRPQKLGAQPPSAALAG